MSLQTAYSTFVSGIVLGVIYALVALGYVVVYRASRVFNFLHPQFMLFGALMFTTVRSDDTSVVRFVVALAGAVVLIGALGYLVYVTIVHRSVGQPHWVQMVLTMGLGIVAVNVAQLIWGSEFRVVPPMLSRVAWSLPGGATITRTDVTVIVIGVALCAGLYWLLTVSSMGVRLRATAENPSLASYSGVRLALWFGVAWAIASAAAVVAGVSYSMSVPLDATLVEVGLIAFPAAMIGGMDSISGCFVGALILAMVRQFSTQLWGFDASTAITFGAVLAILVFRPRGLFGAPISDRV